VTADRLQLLFVDIFMYLCTIQ